jgi:outer membrane protein assembly factor BamB
MTMVYAFLMTQRLTRLLLTLSCGALTSSCADATGPNATDRVVWHVAGRGLGAPALGGSTVYFPTADHAVIALDAGTGALRWRATTGESGQETTVGAGENVVVAGDNVIMPDVRIHAFDAATGATRWVYQPTVGYGAGFFNLITDGTTVFAGSPSGYAFAVDAATGVQRWATQVATDALSTTVMDPVVDQGVVFVTMRRFTNPTSGGVVAIDAVTGAIRWRREFTAVGPNSGSAAVFRCALWQNLVIAAADDGRVYGLDRTTGAIVWTSPRPSDELGYDDQRPLLMVGGTLIVGSDLLRLTGLDPATGIERWRLTNNRSIDEPMAGDGSHLYAVNTDLELEAVDASNGTLAWVVKPAGQVGYGFAPYPAVSATTVYVNSLAGYWAMRK